MSNKHRNSSDKYNEKMLNDKAALQQQQSDEAFIHALYDEISEEHQQGQPSEILDQRILSAAHEAIDPRRASTSKPIRKSKFTWYSSLATAASLMLVVSLVLTQQGNILLNDQSELMPEDNVSLPKESTEKFDYSVLANQEVLTEKSNFRTKANYSAKSKDLPTYPKATLRAITKEKTAQQARYTRESKKKSVQQLMAAAPDNVQFIAKKELELKTEQEIKVIILTTEQFQQYTKLNKGLATEQQWFWSIQSVNNEEYIIDIFQKNQIALRYSLNKTIFNIIDPTSNNSKRSSRTKQALSKITILNTSN